MGDRIAVMSEGLLQQVGAPQDLYDHPVNRFVAGFIGSPSMNFTEVSLTGQGPDAKLEGNGFSFPVPPRYRDAIGPTTGRKLILGFRPEHLEIGDAGEQAAKLEARADVVEYLGNEELLHVTIGGQDVVAIVDASNNVRPGDIVQLAFPLSKLHLFDAEGNGTSLIAQREAVAA
jgi:multiple sugar transport system ATP-binding protein